MVNNTQKATLQIDIDSRSVLTANLSGCFIIPAERPAPAEILSHISQDLRSVQLNDAGINEWDSALLVFIQSIQKECTKQNVPVDCSSMPSSVQRLMALANAVPERKGYHGDPARPSRVRRLGEKIIQRHTAFVSILSFLGETTSGLGRFLVGKAVRALFVAGSLTVKSVSILSPMTPNASDA